MLPFPRWKGELARRDRVRHDCAARYTASRGRVQGWTRAHRGASDRWGAGPREARATAGTAGQRVADATHPLDANIAERSWGAPATRRRTEVVAETTELTVARGDDARTAGGKPVPLAKRGAATAPPNFGWNSCRFLATRFQ